jgi:Phasin protein
MFDATQEMNATTSQVMALFNGGPIADAVLRATESCGQAYLAWQEEVLRFASARIQRDSELGQALAKSRNWQDAAKLQQEWASSAVHDYTEETTRLLEIAVGAGSKITRTSMDAGRSAAQSASDSVHTMTETARSVAERSTQDVRSMQERGLQEATETTEAARPAETPRPRARRGNPAE